MSKNSFTSVEIVKDLSGVGGLPLEDINKLWVHNSNEFNKLQICVGDTYKWITSNFQTDTLPAIGCLPKFSEIIYEFKKRDRNKPLILMGSEHQQLIDYVHESAKEDLKNSFQILAWSSDNSNSLFKKKTSILTSKDFTLGMRIPNSFMARSLIKNRPFINFECKYFRNHRINYG